MQDDRTYHSSPAARVPEAEADPTPDSELLERVAAGEQQALAALFARHGSRLYAVALCILSDPAAAAAVVRSVSRDVQFESRRFSPSQYPVRRWLADATRLTALEYLRARAPGASTLAT